MSAHSADLQKEGNTVEIVNIRDEVYLGMPKKYFPHYIWPFQEGTSILCRDIAAGSPTVLIEKPDWLSH